MRLTYMDRVTYRRKHDPDLVEGLRDTFGDVYVLPEGGSNALAVRGCMEVPREFAVPFDVICCACGTGGTLAGIAAGLQGQQQAIGFSALKGGGFLTGEVQRLQTEVGVPTDNWRIETEFHFGGFAKRRPELDRFIHDFKSRHAVRLDWVYVAKMMAGLFQLIARGTFPRGTTIVAVVTGSAEPEGAGGDSGSGG